MFRRSCERIDDVGEYGMRRYSLYVLLLALLAGGFAVGVWIATPTETPSIIYDRPLP
jgi:hypothetical protein